MFAINLKIFIIELNRLTTVIGYFHVINAGILSPRKINIVMEELENLNH